MRYGNVVFAFVLIATIASVSVRGQGTTTDPYTMLPLPMIEEELSDFSRILMLSEAQEAFLEQLYHEYVDSFARLSPRIDELNRRERSRRTTGVVRGGQLEQLPELSYHEHYEQARSILRDARPLEAALIALDDEFFTKLTAILGESQLERLHHAQRARYRVRYRIRTDALPGAQVDILALLRNLKVDEADDEALISMMSSYEERLVQLLRLRHEAQTRVHLGDLQWLASVHGTQIDQAAIDARGRIRARQIRLESSLRRLNTSTLEGLSVILTQEDATRMFDEFQRIAHPDWFRDASVQRTRELLEEPAALDGLDDNAAAELAYLREHFESNYRRLQRRFGDADFNFNERLYRTLSARFEDMAAHDRELAAILTERDLLSERVTRAVKEIEAYRQDD